MVLHLRGTVVLDDEREVGEAWVVGGRITFERPSSTPDALLEGWVCPGLVDAHCHIGLAPTAPSTGRPPSSRRSPTATRACC